MMKLKNNYYICPLFEINMNKKIPGNSHNSLSGKVASTVLARLKRGPATQKIISYIPFYSFGSTYPASINDL